jgi:hypothetical protein
MTSSFLRPAFAAGVPGVNGLDDRRRRLVGGPHVVLALDQRADPSLLERGDHALVDLREGTPVIETLLDEIGADECGFVVQRDQDAVDALRVVDDALDLRCVLGRFRHREHDRLGAQEPASLGAEVAGGPVADRVDLVVVYAVDLIELLGELVDTDEGRHGEDVAVPHLDHELDVVGATERACVLVVDLDVRMVLRQELAETRRELQLECVVPEENGENDDDQAHRMAIVDQPLAEPVERPLLLSFLLRLGLFVTHRDPSSRYRQPHACRRRPCADRLSTSGLPRFSTIPA